MKIRSGFVSNSSSSSYILGIAKVEDFSKFMSWYKNLDEYIKGYTAIRQVRDIVKSSNQELSYTAELGDYPEGLRLYNFNTSVSIAKEGLSQDDLVFVVATCNDEGDSAFYDSNIGELNWNINLDDLSGDEQAVISGMTEENGMSHISKTFGVSRNG